MKRLTDSEIEKVKVDFVRNMTPEEKIYETKAEIKEDLISYRDLYAIRDEIERLFVNQMITMDKHIPDELVGEREYKKPGRKPKDYKGVCDTCKTPLEDMDGQVERIRKTFNTAFYSPLREVKLKPGEIHCSNIMCMNYNQIVRGD